MLGQYLLSSYDILVDAGCDLVIATAGALHSVYGTDIFNKVARPDDEEGRRLVRKKIGVRSEWLSCLFHICRRRRPSNIENGILYNRKTWLPISEVSIADVQALRLMEAANMLDQSPIEEWMNSLPTVYEVWKTQLMVTKHKCALVLRKH